MSTTRNFPNPYTDYNGEKITGNDAKIEAGLSEKLCENVEKLLEKLETGIENLPSDDRDYSIYTGCGGYAYLYFHLSCVWAGQRSEEYLQKSLRLLKRCLRQLKGRKFSFLCGDAGLLALAAVVHHKLGQQEESTLCRERLEGLLEFVGEPSMPDELLYGRVGYLYSLLFVQTHLGPEDIKPAIIQQVCQYVLTGGQKLSEREKWACPLMFAWHDKHYLGGAHGLAGILVVLMQVNSSAMRPALEKLVRPTIDFMLTLRFPSGNFPSSVGSTSGDKLVQWCHGAPGWLIMFATAYKVFGDGRYLSAARSCADVTWDRGLLKKGDSLCHGTAGNAYGFISLYQLTKDEQYLYRAWKFAEWCFDYDNHRTCQADRPFSLFEGLAGTVYFLADMLDPLSAKFPAFVL